MRFQAKFLQPINSSSKIQIRGSLQRIYDVMRTPDGRLEGEDDDLAKALNHRDALTGRAPADASEESIEA